MRPQKTNQESYQVLSDGITVWVNLSDGSCIGRFGRFGIDIHQTTKKQLAGHPQCLFCTQNETNATDWKIFKEKLKEFYDIDLEKTDFVDYTTVFSKRYARVSKSKPSS